MKIQAIRKACMARGVFYVFDCADGRQFLSNGVAAWPVDGITVTEGMIPALFDLNEKQQQKLSIHEMEMTDERFTLEPVGGETPLEDLGLVWSAGNLYRALKNDSGLLLIDTAQTKPGENKDGNFVYAERQGKPGKAPLIACYGDMLASALVMPVKAGDIRKMLERIAYEPLNVFWSEDEEEES